MGNNIILETKFVADIRGSFYIPSYQRGYRWSETEVVRLLDDIYQNGKKNYSQIAITSWTRRGKNLGHGWSRRIYP